MVEGHSVHRVATFHRQRLVGKQFRATSPNGRFSDGARSIDGKFFARIEAVGKNLFAFFADTIDISENDDGVVVVHVHFGMAGNWSVYDQSNGEDAPEPSKTNRLRLTSIMQDDGIGGLVVDLAAMTVQYGHGTALYHEKRAKLGQDPLRDDADPETLWNKVRLSKKSIGSLIMDQSFFCGPGNIYRAEILFLAGIHPDTTGMHLTRHEFDCIWLYTVKLLKRGYETGSILTVDPGEARALGMPDLRRYIYNTAACPRCSSRIQSWSINNRTCYACLVCQPKQQNHDDSPSAVSNGKKAVAVAAAAIVSPDSKPHVPFRSRCAPEPVSKRIRDAGYQALTVAELQSELDKRGMDYSSSGRRKKRKKELVQLLEEQDASTITAAASTSTKTTKTKLVSSQQAAAEKARANESLAVEHVAELAPSQARRVRRRVATATSSAAVPQQDRRATNKKRRYAKRS